MIRARGGGLGALSQGQGSQWQQPLHGLGWAPQNPADQVLCEKTTATDCICGRLGIKWALTLVVWFIDFFIFSCYYPLDWKEEGIILPHNYLCTSRFCYWVPSIPTVTEHARFALQLALSHAPLPQGNLKSSWLSSAWDPGPCSLFASWVLSTSCYQAPSWELRLGVDPVVSFWVTSMVLLLLAHSLSPCLAKIYWKALMARHIASSSF